MKSAIRRQQSAKSANTVLDRNSSQSVFQKRSIFPSVCGCWGRDFRCRIPCRLNSPSNSVVPRHAVYCRPWSVRISRGVPYAAIARSSASSTSVDRWWCAIACPTMKREWSSMNATRYSRSWRRSRNVNRSDCHSSFGCARSNRRSGCSRGPAGSGASSSPSSWRIRRTTLSETPSASNLRSTSLMRRVPNSGCSSFSAVTASRFGSAFASRTGGTIAFGTSASSPPARYRFTHSETVVPGTPKTRATSDAGAPSSTTSRTTRSFSSTGCVSRPGPPCLEPAAPFARPPPRFVLPSLLICLPFWANASARRRSGC